MFTTHAPLEGLAGVELQVCLHVVEEEAARLGEEETALVLPPPLVVLLVEDAVYQCPFLSLVHVVPGDVVCPSEDSPQIDDDLRGVASHYCIAKVVRSLDEPVVRRRGLHVALKVGTGDDRQLEEPERVLTYEADVAPDPSPQVPAAFDSYFGRHIDSAFVVFRRDHEVHGGGIEGIGEGEQL